MSDLLVRMVASAFFLAVAIARAASLAREEQWLPIWAAETLVYLLIVIAYVRRAPAHEHASTWSEVVLPLVAAPLPFALLFFDVDREANRAACFGLMLAGDLVALVSYAFLGASFSILVEARPLVARGPYRWVRHPIYLGQLVATLGVALLRTSRLAVALWGVFAALQVTRAALEERKLLRATPGYEEYRRRTWAFLPGVY